LVFFPWFFGVGFPLHGYLVRSEISVALIFGSFFKSLFWLALNLSAQFMGMLDWELSAKMWDCKSFWADSQFNRAYCCFWGYETKLLLCVGQDVKF
jgi:hypothetical protein